MRVIEACTKSGGAALSGSDARQERAGIVRRRVGAGGERGEAAEARRRAALRPGVVRVHLGRREKRATSALFTCEGARSFCLSSRAPRQVTAAIRRAARLVRKLARAYRLDRATPIID